MSEFPSIDLIRPDGKPLGKSRFPAKYEFMSRNPSSNLNWFETPAVREFIAEHEQFSGESRVKLKPRDWRPEKETLLPACQAKHFDRQITEIRLVDRATESWEVTVAPITASLGGESWLRFRKGRAVSAEFGI